MKGRLFDNLSQTHQLESDDHAINIARQFKYLGISIDPEDAYFEKAESPSEITRDALMLHQNLHTVMVRNLERTVRRTDILRRITFVLLDCQHGKCVDDLVRCERSI